MKFEFDNSNGVWDQSDKQLFQFLILDKPFIDLVIKARKEIDIDEPNLPKNFTTAQIYEIAKRYTKEIIDFYSLHNSWFHPISFFIATGKVQSPGIGIYMSGFSESFNAIKGKFLYAGPFEITITENIHINNLYKFIKNNKVEIKKALKRLPKCRISIKDLENLKIRLEVKELSDAGLTVKEISEKLLVQYSDLDEQMVRHYIRRNKQFIEGSKIT